MKMDDSVVCIREVCVKEKVETSGCDIKHL